MTASLASLLALAPLSEKYNFYLDSLAEILTALPVSTLNTFRRQVATAIPGADSPPLRSFRDVLDLDLDFSLAIPVVVCVVCAVVAVVVGMSWRNFWRASSTVPKVSERDFSYITDGEASGQPGPSSQQQQRLGPSPSPSPSLASASASASSTSLSSSLPFPLSLAARATYGARGQADGARLQGQQHQHPVTDEPDILLLKHRGASFPLHFAAYAIDDGVLTVQALRQRAAQVTGTSDAARVKLLYKGRLLKDDSRPCKAEGLKQNSEVLCVVSEVQPGESSSSDVSEAGDEAPAAAVRPADDVLSGKGSDGVLKNKKKTGSSKNKKKKKNNSKNKNKNKTTNQHADDDSIDADSSDMAAVTAAPTLTAPSLGKLKTPLEQVHALTTYFRAQLLPLCEAYIAQPPADAKTRDFEQKKLTETIFAQVMLKADGIEPNGDDEIRHARRMLVKEVQATLARLDAVPIGP